MGIEGSHAKARDYLVGLAPRLRGYLYTLLGDAHEAEDVLQDVFLAFLQKGPPPMTPEADRWLFATSRNRALNVFRGRERRGRRESAYGTARAQPAADPAEQAVRHEALRRIQSCLRKMALPWRELLYLKVVENLSVREIAERTKAPKSTVALRVSEGLVLLSRCFHGQV
jgi:RNA polymerase sigma factor (sigma-70 family)